MELPSFPLVDLFAAGVNALNGVLLACGPKHYRGYSTIGLLILAFVGGIGGGLTRDMLLNEVPGPIKDPRFLVVCLLMGLLGLAIYHYGATKGVRFRKTTLAFFKSFTLPWFAILGAQKTLEHDLGIFAAIVVGVIATTAGGVVIDLCSGLTPEILEPAEYLVTTAILASGLYTVIVVLIVPGLPFFPATLIAVLVAFLFRFFATRRHWQDPMPEALADTAPPPPGSGGGPASAPG